ncbi:hypothetical protein M408DRAFT_327333 [Serendipita vermifera MAFF 305830]|uniref:Uncharacterized protein n=1 Tax=Serendipita vermifera MAFF 305830 TaxID=933852 RepID=A0A0C2X0Z2_SERVB|nr:hypothetical protein M408DRAFT_327333 [Serendipita vermifera MAFF 305830]
MFIIQKDKYRENGQTMRDCWKPDKLQPKFRRRVPKTGATRGVMQAKTRIISI